MQAQAEFHRLGLDHALQGMISSSKELRAHMQQQELEFENVKKFCLKGVENTAELHVVTSRKADRLQQQLNDSESKMAVLTEQLSASESQAADLAERVDKLKRKRTSLKEQNKGLTREVSNRVQSLEDVQSCLDTYQTSALALEGEKADLMLHNTDLRHDLAAIQRQVKDLQQQVQHAQSRAHSKAGPGQSVDQQADTTGSSHALQLQHLLLMVQKQQTALTDENARLQHKLAAARAADLKHAASLAVAKVAAAEAVRRYAAAIADAEQGAQIHAATLEAHRAAAKRGAASSATAAEQLTDLRAQLCAAHSTGQAQREADSAELQALLVELQSEQQSEQQSSRRLAQQLAEKDTALADTETRLQLLEADHDHSHEHMTAMLAGLNALKTHFQQQSAAAAAPQEISKLLRDIPDAGGLQTTAHAPVSDGAQLSSQLAVARQLIGQLQQQHIRAAISQHVQGSSTDSYTAEACQNDSPAQGNTQQGNPKQGSSEMGSSQQGSAQHSSPKQGSAAQGISEQADAAQGIPVQGSSAHSLSSGGCALHLCTDVQDKTAELMLQRADGMQGSSTGGAAQLDWSFLLWSTPCIASRAFAACRQQCQRA